jgi:predicted permease
MLGDLRYAVRSFLKTPILTTVIIATLALGIGANTAIFSVVDAVLLRPTPIHDIGKLAVVWETDRNTGTTREPSSLPDYLDFKARSRAFERLAAMMTGEVNLTPASGDPVRLPVLRMSADALPMLGLRPLLGRAFSPEEDRAGGADVVVISESLWTRSFDRDESAIGRILRLDDRPYVIVGVMAEGADFGVLQILSAAAYSRGFADRGMKTSVDLWAPLQGDVQALPRSTHPIFVLGRLAPGATMAGAQTEMTAVAADLERAFPENTARGVHIERLESVVFGPVRPALLVLLGAVALVLLVACVNVANLLLARASARGHETAIRAALGATQGRMARQVLAETLVLSLTAAIAGVGLAYLCVRGLVFVAPADVPRLSLATINVPVLLTTLAVAVLAGFAFSVLPMLQARRLNLRTSLAGSSGRGSAAPSRSRIRGILVVAELAMAVVLVCGAALLIRSFWTLQRVDLGFAAEGVLKAEYQLPPSRYPVDFRRWPDFTEQHAFNAALLQRAATLPGVTAAAIAGNHPLDPGYTNSFTIVGREAEARTWPEISIRRVSPSYFETVDLKLLNGRAFRDSDTTAAPPVAVINAAAARQFFTGREPLGAHIRFWGASRLIVGVVADEKFHGVAEAAPIAAYTPIAQRRFTMLLLALFAGSALLLAAVGIHGVLSYSVSQRRREIGIRMALGARRTDVVGAIMREAVSLTGVGLALGLGGAVALTRVLRGQLFGIAPTDPATFAAVAAVLAAVALAATFAPARRASRIDPIVALRSE